MSCRLRGYPWPSLATSPYQSSPPAGLQGYIPCPHTAAVCRFVLVVPLLHIHVWGSTGVHRLWARPCFSSSVLRVWFVEFVLYTILQLKYGNVINFNDDFNKRTNTFLYINLSHFIFEKVMFVVGDKLVGDKDGLQYWPKFTSWP